MHNSPERLITRSRPHILPAPSSVTDADQRKRVLIVDDDVEVLASLAAVLESEGYEVEVAEGGYQALRRATASQPDLVLLDLNMPNLDGWTTFAKVDRSCPLVAVIVITARPNQYQEAVRLGVDAFMEKPLDFPVLLRAIRRLTREPEARRTRRITNRNFATWHLRPRQSKGSVGPI